jgi:hypothetical protein
MTDTTRLSAPIMADEMIDALRRLGVEVDLDTLNWHRLLQGIAEGVINHLRNHEQALTILRHTSSDFEHDHGEHVRVRM